MSSTAPVCTLWDFVPNPPEFLTDVFALPSDPDSHVSFYTGSELRPTPTPRTPDATRPYVTLTFAQSLDAKIAGPGGKQLALSGRESLVMTHWMRTMHDAILIGVGTALNDDPQLNTRHLPPLPVHAIYDYSTPRPIVLDTRLRLRPQCKLLRNFKEGRGRRPWVICAIPDSADQLEDWVERRTALEDEGAKVLVVKAQDGRIHIPTLLSKLRKRRIRSVMVEGGAQIIQSFLAAAAPPPPEAEDFKAGEDTEELPRSAVDMIVVTVAPTFVGKEGVGYGNDLVAEKLPSLQFIGSELFGRDSVVALENRCRI
ncbi:hypothetical protein OBBRIDRAFT_787658 [Obba rivulosa]|uniref:2,5-diamino-6-ribosylamino-4(3H)-pyrimidinone 5'-phosphate reductase n=1 Tax=Obba rivulosa TaxID=1052685 RepID=A0A8E2J751_9APHY|nr:hypothetical protein OBBRIDRAFT_787658 [Obba rivulosa]